jgi:hypothetical protein
MKTRDGFVSNSSSSSFIVCFPDGKPKNVSDLQKLLFDDKKKYYEFKSSDIAAHVWHDLKGNRALSKKKLAEELSREVMTNDATILLQFPMPGDPYGSVTWNSLLYESLSELYFKALEKRGSELSEHLMKTHPGKYYLFEISDNSDIEGAMENGDLFKRLFHVYASNH